MKRRKYLKAIFSLRKHSYLKTVGVFLIAVALIAGVVGCEGEPAPTYALATAVAPAGTGTATDQTGTSPYEEGEIIDIEAVAADCFRFTGWTSSAGGTFGAASNATTTFTMPANDVTVTASFEEVPPDHYKFYWTNEGAPYIGEVVLLEDQFGTFNATVGYAMSFGNPVEKVHADIPTPIEDDLRHYTLYELDYGEEMPMLDSWEVMVNNQFQDDVVLTVVGPLYLAVPTQKEDHEAPVCLDHLLVYDVIHDEPFPEVGIQLKDQFIDEDVTVWEPIYFANPVRKTVAGAAPTPIEHEDEHYVFYAIEDLGHESIDKIIQIDNQFGPQTLPLTYRDSLAVPSQKIDWWQVLDHFTCYWTFWGEEPPPVFPVPVELEDQFIAEWLGEPLIAQVGMPVHFANPANKGHEVWTPVSNWNDHYTFYELIYEEVTPIWYVEVSNQFDPVEPGYQELYVEGPTYLAVPTKKGPHGWPVNLDHMLVYTVWGEPPSVGAEVYLEDQFADYWTNVHVPGYFANPVRKIDPTGVTDIMHPEDHLVLYWIDGSYFPTIEDLPIDNQFGPQFLDVWPDEGILLGVPSQKLTFSLAI
jgi:uncharacterized repeat protein (TIGR02543 family)